MEYGVCFDQSTGKILFDDVKLVFFRHPDVIDVYYGVSSDPTVIESYIKSNFLTKTGNVGNTSGRTYIFSTGYTYKYWCIQDIPNLGSRVISSVRNGSTPTVLAYDYYYLYYQEDPTPTTPITYGKITIDGFIYRIYRTIAKTSLHNVQYVYSF